MEPPVIQEADPVPTSDEKTLALVMHILGLVGFGIISTLIIWLIKKDESAFLNKAGKELLNFQISLIIYLIAAAILTFCLVGIPILIAIGFGSLVLEIIGIIRISEGKIYRYPAILRLVK